MITITTKSLIGAATVAIACSLTGLQAQPYDYYDRPYAGASSGAGSSGRYTTPLSGKLYFGFDAGAAWQQDITLSDDAGDSETVTFDPGARLDCQLGYNITTNWAAELEFGLIISPVKNSSALGTDYMDVDLVEFPLLVNAIYTHPLGRHFSVYAGGGIGGVFCNYNDEFGDSTPTESAFAFQGLAGVKYTINDRWDVGIGYKFLGTTSHDVGSGVAYDETTHQYLPTEFHSDGNLTHSIVAALTCRF